MTAEAVVHSGRRFAVVALVVALLAPLLGVATAPPVAAAEPKVQLGGGPLPSARTQTAASGRNAYAVWEDYSVVPGVPLVRLARSTDRGETWDRSLAGVMSTANGYRPSIAVAGDDVHISWEHYPNITPTNPGYREIRYRVSHDGGATFEDMQILDAGEPTPLDSHDPKVAATANRALVAWENGYGGQAIRVAVVDTDGTFDVRDLGPGSAPTVVAQDGAGVVAFHRVGGAAEEVWAAFSPDLDNFDPPVEISTTPATASRYPVPAMADGYVHVAWHEDTVPPTIRVASSADGVSFDPPVVLGEGQPIYPWGGPSIAAYPGRVAVAWGAADHQSVQVASSSDHGAAFTTLAVPGNAQGVPALAVPAATTGPRAVFDWSMPDRFGIDADTDGVIDEHNDAGYVSPTQWTIELDGSASTAFGGGPVTCEWRVDSSVVGTTCDLTHHVPSLGAYDVQLTVEQPDGQRDQRTRTIDVRDHLVVSIGDSVASGEGTPDKPIPDLAWNDEQCHRSALGGPAQAALQLEQADPHSSVTFLHLACSGASITGADVSSGGLLTPYEGIVPGAALPPQVEQIDALVGSRDIDALMLSIGANDAKFSTVVKDCIGLDNCHHNAALVDGFDQRLADLPARYDQLSIELDSRVAADKVFITEYPDPTIPDSGAWDLSCVLDSAIIGGLISGGEARWASEHVAAGINDTVAAAASAHGWKHVGGISSAFRGHGYCANDHWIVQIGESRDRQDDNNGSFHPNADGHQQYGSRLATAIGDYWEDTTPAPPAHPVASALGDLYLGWVDQPNVMGTVLVESGSGLAELETRTVSTPTNPVGGGWVSIAASSDGAWLGWTEQTSADYWDAYGFRAFAGTLVHGPPNLRPTDVGLVQGPSHPFALVAGRTAAVEATFDSTFTSPVTADVDFAILDGDDVVVASGTQPASFTTGTNRLLLTPSPAFLPTDGEEYSARVTVDPGTSLAEADEGDNEAESAAIPTEPSRGMKIVYVPLAGASCPAAGAVRTGSQPFLEGVLPIPDGEITASTNCGFTASGLSNTHAGAVDALNDMGTLAALSGIDFLVGVTPSKWIEPAYAPGTVGLAIRKGGAAAEPPTRAALVDLGYTGGDVVAHEMLHSFGKPHEDGVPAPGWWVALRTQIDGLDLMEPEVVPNPWLSAPNFEWFRNRLENTKSDPEILVLRGMVAEDGTVTADPWYRHVGILDVPFDSAGEFTLEYRDGNGAVLESTGFDAGASVGFGAASAADEPTGPRGFNVAVPDLPAGTAELRVLDGTDVVLTRAVSDNAPTNSVSTPVDDAVVAVGDEIEVTIDASDADGDALHHAVFVTIDNGSTWRPLDLDQTGDTYTFPATFDLASTQVRVRVLTTDGVHTSLAESGTFTISQDVPVGERIVYVRQHIDADGSHEGLWTMAADGTDQQQVPLPDIPLEGSYQGPQVREPMWSPDGTHIVFSSRLTETSPGVYDYNSQYTQLWSVRPSGDELTQLTPAEYDGAHHLYRCPAWSPDGTQIAMFSISIGDAWPSPIGHSILVMDADGSNLHAVHDFPIDGGDVGTALNQDSGTCPTWSPDGQHLAFMAGIPFDGQHLFTVDVDGSNFTERWDGPPDATRLAYADWSADGSELYATVMAPNVLGTRHEIWRVPLDGAAPEMIIANGASSWLVTPKLSPDGTRIYGSRRIADPDTYTGDIFDLATWSLDGTGPELVHAPGDAYDILWPDWIGTDDVDPPPTPQAADAGGPYDAIEDIPLQLDAGRSTLAEGAAPLTEWDLDADGQFDDALGLRPLVTFPHPGPVTVKVRLTPSAGPASMSEAVTIEVAPAAPTLVAPTSISGVAGAPVTLPAAFEDPGGAPHAASIDWGAGGGPQAAPITPTADGGTVTGEFTYASAGAYVATVEVCDDPGPCATVGVDVDITSTAPPDLPPIAGDADATTPGRTTVWVSLPASDPEGLGVTVAGIGPASHGTVAGAGGGFSGEVGVAYTPEDGFAGVDSFTYTVTDGRQQSAPATVTVTVGNQAPVAGSDSATGAAGEDTIIEASVLLANDTDPDDTGTLSVAGVYDTAGTHGTVDVDGTTITYTPADGFSGTATFEYAVTDGGAAGLGTVEVDVSPAAGTPGPPLDVSAIGGDAEAEVRWHPPGSDGGSPLTGYDVRVTPSGSITSAGPSVLSTVIGALTNGTDYTFAVRARNAVGPGPWSAESNVARPRPSCAGDAFGDVAAAHPFCPEIQWLVDEGVAEGYPDGNYRPGAPITRQAMAAFLYRLAGSELGPDPACGAAPFPDVPAGHPFCGEIQWLVAEGVTEGYADGTFRPAAPISRQAMAAFLHRLAGTDLGASCDLAPFSDVAVSHPFCGDIDWMVINGITGGYDDGTFRPTGTVTRQAVAAYLLRFNVLTGILP